MRRRLITHPAPELLPHFDGHATADTVVFLLAQYPAWYAPSLDTEMRSLRDSGIDVQVLPLEGPPHPSLSRELTRAMRGLAHCATAHLRTARSARAAYARGLRSAVRYARCEERRVSRHVRWLWYFVRAVAIGDRLHRGGVTRCHAHFTTNIAVLIAEVFAIDVSLTLHGPTDFAHVSPGLLRAKVAASSFTRTISVEGMRRVLQACPQSQHGRIIHVPLGVDLGRFTARTARRSEPKVRVVCVARLEAVKGHSVLIDAFARLTATGAPVELLLVGDGRLRRAIGRQVRRLGLQSRVICTGVVDNGELPSILRTADVFVLASYAEGLPVALMEAMASGLACIATRVNGVPELIAHERTGLLVPPGDVTALTNALAALVAAPARREALGRAGLHEVRRKHDARLNADRMAANLLRRQREWRSPLPALSPARSPIGWVADLPEVARRLAR